jgi:hypothetical protein
MLYSQLQYFLDDLLPETTELFDLKIKFSLTNGRSNIHQKIVSIKKLEQNKT